MEQGTLFDGPAAPPPSVWLNVVPKLDDRGQGVDRDERTAWINAEIGLIEAEAEALVARTGGDIRAETRVLIIRYFRTYLRGERIHRSVRSKRVAVGEAKQAARQLEGLPAEALRLVR